MKLDFKARLTPTGPKGAWAFLHFPFDMLPDAALATRLRADVA